jgi:hypothetical protein
MHLNPKPEQKLAKVSYFIYYVVCLISCYHMFRKEMFSCPLHRHNFTGTILSIFLVIQLFLNNVVVFNMTEATEYVIFLTFVFIGLFLL